MSLLAVARLSDAGIRLLLLTDVHGAYGFATAIFGNAASKQVSSSANAHKDSCDADATAPSHPMLFRIQGPDRPANAIVQPDDLGRG